MSKILSSPVRERIAWSCWDAKALKQRVSHPTVYRVTEPDGYERLFDTRLEADDFIRAYNAEVA